MDLISRQKAIDAVHYYIESGYKCDIFQELKELPSVEPERTAKVKRCSFSEYLTYDFDGQCDCGKWVDFLWSYCPSCGAKLDWK